MTMKTRWIVLMCGGLWLSGLGVQARQPDYKDCKDHPLFPTRVPNYRISDCKVEEYGMYEFYAVKGPKTPVEGKLTYIAYGYIGPQGNEPSGLAVVRNYENAIRKVGGTVLQSDPQRWVNGKIVQNGQEAWVQVEKGNSRIWLRIVEKKAMEQYVTADAAAFGNDLKATGHAAVYGIYFDTGKSALKPESAAAIGEIAKLLKGDPSLKIHVVGHTDNVGDIDANIKLSRDRAEAVLQALVRDHGIAQNRMNAHGCGPFAPVASTDTDDARAKNRRVELVKQ
jgi:OOP family OmpA-OmpF porin